MDLGAYAQIGDYEKLAEANGIDIPRLRGYRLMSEEAPISQSNIKEVQAKMTIQTAESLCAARPFWSPHPEYRTYCWETDVIKDYYLVKGRDGNYIDIRWDRIHGWKRKVLKFEIKKAKRKVQQQFDIWNKYAGQKDVLYIHSRMGGNNWKYYDGKVELQNQPWFLDRVDDWFDSTYCDFYARVDVSGFVYYLKEEYAKSDVVMSEFLRSYGPLPVPIMKELLAWSGDDEYIDISDTGELVVKKSNEQEVK